MSLANGLKSIKEVLARIKMRGGDCSTTYYAYLISRALAAQKHPAAPANSYGNTLLLPVPQQPAAGSSLDATQQTTGTG
jgi:hypothetical protein